MGFFSKLFRRKKLLVPVNEVFTPTSPAKRVFVEREVEAKRLRSALNTIGAQIVIFGESGAGKTSLAEKVLAELNRNYVTTRCTSTTSFQQIVDSGFDHVNAFAHVERQNRNDAEFHGNTSLGIGKDGIGAKIGGGYKALASRSDTSRRIVDPQTDPNSLARLFKKQSLTWVIEDFHKVSDEVRAQFADVLKIFSDTADPKVAIILLGARETSDGVVGLPDANLTNRLAPIELRPLTDGELGRILSEGGEILKVDFSEVRAEIIASSAGVASVTHGLAKACLDQMDIFTEQDAVVTVPMSILADAASEYVNTYGASVRAAFTKALTDKNTRQGKYKNYQIVVRALASFPEHGATHGQLLSKIQQEYPGYPGGNLNLYLGKLSEEERGEVVRFTSDGKYRFNVPLQLTYARTYFGIATASSLWAKPIEQYVPGDHKEGIESAEVRAPELGQN